MREIKFRAWDKEDKQMLPVDYMKLEFGKVPYVNGEAFSENDGWFDYEFCDDDFELMQYTGLKDKNGTEIYEGDIIAPVNDNEIEARIFYDDECFSWRVDTGLKFSFYMNF